MSVGTDGSGATQDRDRDRLRLSIAHATGPVKAIAIGRRAVWNGTQAVEPPLRTIRSGRHREV